MIVCGGEALMDMVPEGGRGDVFLARPGGCPYNTAIAAARLGAKAAFLGRLGRDFLGSRLCDTLAANGVDLSGLARSEEETTLAFVTRDSKGNAQYAFYSEGAADRNFAEDDLPARLPPEARFLVVGSITMVQEPIGTTVETLVLRESSRLLVSFDPNIRPSLIADRSVYLDRFERWLAAAAIVKISSDDLSWLYPELSVEAGVDRLRAGGPSLVIATLGDRGALAVNRSDGVFSESFKVQVADTIGAGDTFHAAVLARLDEEGIATRRELELLDAPRLAGLLRFANAAAALNCTRAGAEPPTRGETLEFLESRSQSEGGWRKV